MNLFPEDPVLGLYLNKIVKLVHSRPFLQKSADAANANSSLFLSIVREQMQKRGRRWHGFQSLSLFWAPDVLGLSGTAACMLFTSDSLTLFCGHIRS